MNRFRKRLEEFKKRIIKKEEPKMKYKICIISAATENLSYQYDVTNKNKEEYCKKHGYDYQFIKLDVETIKSYHSRKKILIDIINSKKYDWVMWMDVDAWFNNFDISLDSILNTCSKDVSMLVSRDHGVINDPGRWLDCYINSGILIFKCNDISLKIIDLWDNPISDAKKVMSKYTKLNDQPYLSILCLWDSFVRQHTYITSPSVLNIFARYGFNKYTFILHVPGLRCSKTPQKDFIDLYNKSLDIQGKKLT